MRKPINSHEKEIALIRAEAKAKRKKSKDAIDSILKDFEDARFKLRSDSWELPKKWQPLFRKTTDIMDRLEKLAWDLTVTNLEDEMQLINAEIYAKARVLNELIEKANKPTTDAEKGGV